MWGQIALDKTQTLKMWQNSKTQIATKLKNSKFDKTLILKIWQNSKILNVTKLKNSTYNRIRKTQNVSIYGTFKKSPNMTKIKTSKCDN